MESFQSFKIFFIDLFFYNLTSKYSFFLLQSSLKVNLALTFWFSIHCHGSLETVDSRRSVIRADKIGSSRATLYNELSGQHFTSE